MVVNFEGRSYFKLNLCGYSPLNDTSYLKDFLAYIYADVAQYGSLEKNSSTICNAINKGSKGKDMLSRIYAGALAYVDGASKCLDMSYFYKDSYETIVGYAWQVIIFF